MIAAQAIDDVADQVRREFDPQRIILFGSHADGSADADSDVDLLIIMPDGGDPVGQALAVRERLDCEFPLDLIVRSEADLAWRLEHEDWFLRDIMDRGRVLYEAADLRPAAALEPIAGRARGF